MSDLISREALLADIADTIENSGCVNHERDIMDSIRYAPAIHACTQRITGDTSDGYHTFNELYHHRAILFAVICNNWSDVAWKARQHHDGTMYPGMFIVGIQTPEGSATYHYDIDPYWDMFKVKEFEVAPEWDGHTPAQAIERIGHLAAPVMHAYWKLSPIPGRPMRAVCSWCNSEGLFDYDMHDALMYFCCGCGRRMDGQRAGEGEHG